MSRMYFIPVGLGWVAVLEIAHPWIQAQSSQDRLLFV